MTDEQTHKPNEEGFGGDPTTPEPAEGSDTPGGESVAVPAGDLTQAITESLEPGRDDPDTRD